MRIAIGDTCGRSRTPNRTRGFINRPVLAAPSGAAARRRVGVSVSLSEDGAFRSIVRCYLWRGSEGPSRGPEGDVATFSYKRRFSYLCECVRPLRALARCAQPRRPESR